MWQQTTALRDFNPVYVGCGWVITRQSTPLISPLSREARYTSAPPITMAAIREEKMFPSSLRSGALTCGCVLASALGSTASAQLLNHKDLSASIAITIAQTAIETCKANGYAVSATVVGRNGEIIVCAATIPARIL